MRVLYDDVKRAATLAERGLDMADAGLLFLGPHVTFEDDRRDYGERREITVGFLAGRMVFLVWTERDGARRIISMRKANERERAEFEPVLASLG
jgi:uncharacterized DUF497 family protein